MFKVGLTGNIGSGKSTVAAVFQVLGVPVFFADETARSLYAEAEVSKRIRELFGEEFYNESGNLDRKKMADLVFTDRQELQKLNAIIHPLVRERFENWSREQEDHPYVLYEAAILFESGFYLLMDSTILVTALEAIRIRRIIERDGITGEQVRHRLQNQWPESKKIPRATYIINNDEQHQVLPQVLSIHKEILKNCR